MTMSREGQGEHLRKYQGRHGRPLTNAMPAWVKDEVKRIGREILKAKIDSGMAMEDIADVIGVSKTTVSSTIHRPNKTLVSLIRIAGAMGYRLALEPMPKGERPPQDGG
jgi:hypothetical protein